MKDNLKACPYCGGRAVIKNTQADEKEYYVICENCGILSGLCKDKQEIFNKWNARAEKMLPCPYCGGKGELCEDDIGDLKIYTVICEDCGMIASSKDTEEDAIAAWNKRA